MCSRSLICFAALSVSMLLFVTGCGKKKMTEEQIQEYVSDESNGLIQGGSVHGVKIEVQNKPVALIISQEIKGQSQVPATDSAYKEAVKTFGSNLYFNMNLSVNDQDPLLYAGSMSNFSSLLQTMAFQMDKFVFLTTSEKDTIPVADFVYPRLYGMGAGSSILFAFVKDSTIKWDKTEWVDFHLQEFGMNTGNRNYRFKKSDLEDVPDLLVE